MEARHRRDGDGEFGPFEQVVLENGSLRVVILPKLGGKTVSIRDLRTGREWLDRPAGRPFLKPEADSLWGDWDRSGWDEMLPTVDPCSVVTKEGVAFDAPDHGELWSNEWDCSRRTDGSVALAATGRHWPYRFEKRISISGGTILNRYRLENRADAPFPFIWAPHPIVAAREGMRVVLPDSVKEVVVSGASDAGLGGRGTRISWPGDSLDVMPAATEERFHKLYAAERLSEGWCTIEDARSGETFRLEFDPGKLPYLGLWMNAAGWGGEYHLALEPATGFLDHLGEAYASGSCAVLPPFGTFEWELRCTIGRDGQGSREGGGADGSA